MAEKQYTRQAQEALNMARKIAAELKHPYVGTEHLLFGLKRVFTGVAGQVLDKNKVDEEQMEKAMDILVSAPDVFFHCRTTINIGHINICFLNTFIIRFPHILHIAGRRV